MKKFTIISLMLVLVASFVFAAGLTPYVSTGHSVRVGAADETWYIPSLTSQVFNGYFIHGFNDASGKVDVNFELDATYYGADGDVATEARVLKYFYPKDKTFKYYSGAENDQLTVAPSVNAEYYSDNLRGNVSLAAYNYMYGNDMFTLGNLKVVNEAVVSAQYAKELSGSSNIVKAVVSETVDFGKNVDGYKFTSATNGEVDFYVPKAGTTTKTVMSDDFDTKATKKAYVFRGWVGGNLSFGASDGTVAKNSVLYDATAGMDYKYYIAGGFANLGGSLTYNNSVSGVKDVYTAKANFEYKNTIVKGANAKDVFAVDLTSDVTYVNKPKSTTTINAGATVSIPRLIPVELIDNASYNLPMDFKASYKKVLETSDYLSAAIVAYPVYVEFDGTNALFNKALKNFTLSFTYGNEAKWNEGVKGDHKYVFGAGAKLVLDGATFNLTYDYHEDDGRLVTLSYGVDY